MRKVLLGESIFNSIKVWSVNGLNISPYHKYTFVWWRNSHWCIVVLRKSKTSLPKGWARQSPPQKLHMHHLCHEMFWLVMYNSGNLKEAFYFVYILRCEQQLFTYYWNGGFSKILITLAIVKKHFTGCYWRL